MTLDESAATTLLKRTPLFEIHRELGARMVEFGGWEMPVQYTGVIDEHRAVRERAGLFDVSHMGEFRVEGPGAEAFLQGLVPNNVARLAIDQALYTQICRPDGGTVDDLIIYRRGDQHYMVVVNAGTMEKDWDWFTEHAAGHDDFTLTNISSETALLALQGPLAETILQPLTTSQPLSEIAYYHSHPGTGRGHRLHHLAHWLHRRGWLRAVLRLAGRSCTLARADGGGHTAWTAACRAGRARHAAPRSGLLPLRPRTDRGDHTARSWPRLDDQAG